MRLLRPLVIIAACLLIALGFSRAQAQTAVVRYVTTGCANNGDGTGAGCAGSAGGAGAYNTCANAEIGTRPTTDLLTDNIQVTIHFRQNTATPAPDGICEFRVENWGDGDATRYLHLINDQDPGGVWDTSLYHMSAAAFFRVLSVEPAFSIVDRMQVEQTRAADDGRTHVMVSDGRFQVYRSNVVKNTNTTETNINHGFGIGSDDRDNHGAVMINNVAIGGTRGFSIRPILGSGLAGFLANNTAVGQSLSGIYNNRSIASSNGSTVYVYNNIMDPNGAGGEGYSDVASPQAALVSFGNFTADATSPDGAANQNKTFSFVNLAGEDYHLQVGDTSGAFGGGQDLTTDPVYAFSDDVDGQSRAGNCWDAGYDEVDIDTSCGSGGSAGVILRRRRWY